MSATMKLSVAPWRARLVAGDHAGATSSVERLRRACTCPAPAAVWSTVRDLEHLVVSRIRLLTARLTISTSTAGDAAAAVGRGTRRCETTARSDSETMVRTWSCSSGGKAPMRRLMVRMALPVCRVASTRCPVSAAVSASEMVSWSRSSPSAITSGSSRRAARRARAKSSVCGADLALIDQRALRGMHELDRVLDGEDVVRRLLVDQIDQRRQGRGLAAAGGPGDQHQPLVVVRQPGELGGRPRSASVGGSAGMKRKTTSNPRCWR